MTRNFSLPTTSYTRLSSYPKCPTKYNNTYENKITTNLVESIEESLITGTLTHLLLEEYLKEGVLGDKAKDLVVDLVVDKWLRESCKLEAQVDNDEFIAAELNVIGIKKYIKEVGKIYRKCAANYIKEDAIRNTDMSVPKDPIKYPPTVLKKEINSSGLNNLGLGINNSAAIINPQFRRIVLTEVLGKAGLYFYSFEVPQWVKKTLAVELRFDDYNLEWKNKIWLGGIDWVFETVSGEIVICDHKTEKEKTSELDVQYHPQLNLYVNLYYSITKIIADYVAINHLPSGNIVLAKVDASIVYRVVKGLEDIEDAVQESIRTGKWRKALAPLEYNSPCLTRDWQTKKLSRVCKYFRHCWPNYSEEIAIEIKNFEIEGREE